MPRPIKGGWSPAALAAAVLAATASVLVLAAARLPDLMDPATPLTAGQAKGIVGFHLLAVATIALAALVLPRERLWLPVAASAGLAALALLATLTVGREAWSFTMALLTMGACWRTGRWLLERLRVPALAATPPAAWLAGAGVLGLALLLTGRLGALRWWTVGLPVIGLGLSAAPPALRAIRTLGPARERLTRPGAAGAAITLLLLAFAAVFAAAPELMYDALSSKAWLPSEWARTGSIEPSTLKEHPHLNLIGFTPVLAIPGHLVDAGGVGRYIQFLALAGAAGSVWWLARRSPWAPVAATAVAITPHLFWQATTAYDDAALTLGGVGLAAAFVRLVEAPAAPVFAGGLAAGVLAGASVDLKLHLAPLAAGLLAAWLLAHGPGRLRAGAGALAGGALVAGPPLLLRWIELGNPVLPTFNHVFESRYWPVTGDAVSFPAAYGNPATGGEAPGTLDRLREPFDVLLHTATDTGRLSQAAPDGSFGFVAAAAVVAVLLLWSRGRGARAVIVLWGGLVVALAGWYQEFQYLRFLLPTGAVALAALALAAPPRPLGAGAQRAVVAALALAAVLMWPPTVAQYWNVPGRDLPAKAALDLEDSYDYERRSMPERDALAAYDRIAAPGDIARSVAHQRLWLSEGRSVSPDLEVPNRLASASAGPVSDPEIVRYRRLGVGWILGPKGAPPFTDPGVPELVAAHGEIAWTDGRWLLVRLAERPRPPARLACDERLEGRPGCWQGTLDPRPGYVVEESPTGIAREVPICPGRTLIVDVTVRGEGPAVGVEIDFDFPPRPRPLTRLREELALPRGGTGRVPATAPPGTRTGARVTVFGAKGRVVESVALGTLGRCRTDLPGPGD